MLGIYQTLAAEKMLAFEQKTDFLQMASRLVECNVEMVLIKVLQVLLLITTREDIIKPPLASHTFSLCLSMLSSRSAVIRSSVFAVLQQTYSQLFGRHGDSLQELDVEGLHNVCYEQLQKLATLLRSKDCGLKYLGMDLLAMAFCETKVELVNTPRMTRLLEKECIAYLKNCLRTEVNSFATITKVIRCSTQLILSLRISYDLLQHILILADSVHLWQQYLALESFSILLNRPKQIEAMNSIRNSYSNSMVLSRISQ